MDTPKTTKIISAMFLDVITGDVHIRNQYMNTMLTYIAVYLRKNKLNPHLKAIERFRTRLHNTVSMILHNNHPLPAWNTNREAEIKSLMNYFDRFVIRVDASVADEIGVTQIGLIHDIETLEYCRNICYSASADYSDALAGKPEGLTQASNKYAYVIDLVTPIIDEHNIVDISESDFANSAKIAAMRLEKAREATK